MHEKNTDLSNSFTSILKKIPISEIILIDPFPAADTILFSIMTILFDSDSHHAPYEESNMSVNLFPGSY